MKDDSNIEMLKKCALFTCFTDEKREVLSGETLVHWIGPSGQPNAPIQAKRPVLRTAKSRLTEFALLRESLGFSGINHSFRVHSHTIFQNREAAKVFNEVGQRSHPRLFLGFTEDSSE